MSITSKELSEQFRIKPSHSKLRYFKNPVKHWQERVKITLASAKRSRYDEPELMGRGAAFWQLPTKHLVFQTSGVLKRKSVQLFGIRRRYHFMQIQAINPFAKAQAAKAKKPAQKPQQAMSQVKLNVGPAKDQVKFGGCCG